MRVFSDRLLFAHASYHEFTEANVVFESVLDLVKKEESWSDGAHCFSQLFTVFSVFFFHQYNYSDVSFKFNFISEFYIKMILSLSEISEPGGVKKV